MHEKVVVDFTRIHFYGGFIKPEYLYHKKYINQSKLDLLFIIQKRKIGTNLNPVVKKTTQTEEHHRRPRSLGGSGNSSNLSFVLPRLHRYWHTLFGNMNAYQICNEINTYYKPEGVVLILEFINGTEVKGFGGQNSKKKGKRTRAWNGLFGGKTFEEIIAYINNTWLDPAYHLYIKY